MPKKVARTLQNLPLEKAVLALLSQHRDKGLLFKDILHLLPRKDLNRKSLRIVLEELMKARRIRMVSKHYILHHRIGKTRATQPGHEVIGNIVLGKGQNLLLLSEELEHSAIIYPENQHQAIPGDTVKAMVFRRPGQERFQARVIRIHKRPGRTCLLRVRNGRIQVRLPLPLPVELVGEMPPDDAWRRAEILPEIHPHKIVARMLDTGKELRDLDLVDVIDQYDLPDLFPPGVLQEAQGPFEEQGPRTDLTDLITFTIDGADAKDFDDAISLETHEAGYTLWVHIADVAHYVRFGTALDKEAIKRATSVYFPRHVLPMLPENLSNNLCSLVPNQKRHALSLKMELSPRGIVKKAWLTPSYILSRRRFTYDEVQDIVDKKLEDPIQNVIFDAHKLFLVLNKKRQRDGAIDFDLPEAILHLNEEAQPESITRTERKDSHRMIEEFMLLANETIARFFIQSKVTGVFRHHPIPKKDDVRGLMELFKSTGVSFSLKDAHIPKTWQKLIESLNPKSKAFLQPLILRTMQQAHYRTDDSSHFGLAKEFYAHFTSPIRRYPDLLVHRQLHRVCELEKIEVPVQIFPLNKQLEKKLKVHAPEDLPHLSMVSSRRERRAIDAERDYTQRKKTLFAMKYIGKEFEATVSGLTSSGIFLELAPFPIEGMLPFNSMPGHWIQQKELYQAYRRRPERALRIGDTIRVRIAAADPKRGRVDFEPAETL